MNLGNMHKLKKGWDSGGGKSIDPKAIETAKTIMTVLAGFQAVPTKDGGVQLERHRDGESIEIEISVYK